MARSASRAAVATAPVLLLAGLAGCATTQQEAARLQVNSARDRASQLPVRVTVRNPEIAIQAVGLVATRRGAAVVVRLRNLLEHPVSDLPISVGVIAARGRRQYLNGAPGGDYFLTHIPSVAGGGVLTWVFTTHRSLAPGARVFATVGLAPPPQVPKPRALPRITVTVVAQTPTHARRGRLRLIVRNLSSVPQYQLQVYAVARRSGRDVAAGRATVAHLGDRGTAALNVQLDGSAAAGSVAFEAPPTIFG